MKYFHFLILFLTISGFISCDKAVIPPPPDPVYEITVQNDIFEIQAKYALFVSNEDGEVVAFRWLPAEDSAQVQVPGSSQDDLFDVTLLKVTTLEAPGSGVKDTTLTLTTYTQVASGRKIHLRDQYFHQVSTLRFTLTGFTTLDSIVVSDALTLSRPQALNNYYGEYLVNNTGRCWVRVLINGEPFWRFLTFNNMGPVVDASTVDVSTQFLGNFSPPLNLGFPFVTTWQYKLDGVVDTSKLEFFPLSEYIRAPGGEVPAYSSRKVFEPVNNDLFDPNRPYIDLFRLNAYGPIGTANGYSYYIDQFFPAVPSTLPEPTFDLEATTLSNNRAVAVTCVGGFDVLTFSRIKNTTPKIKWEVVTKPANGPVLYILPDVPAALGQLYPSLSQYDFDNQVQARADNYRWLNYEQAVQKMMENADPLWRARGEYLGREEQF
ncbi:MAG TPA: hypothetical protein VK168_05345 [Saprospiraceae bacterium]|nr:hypothetical protein [Saprospiraceae bacterium]